MKTKRMIGYDGLYESLALPIKRIEKLPLPYTGNKKKLLYNIYKTILKYNLQFDTVLDAFTGSASMALLFKVMGKKVIANDLLTSSYINAVAFVENPGISLSDEDKDFVLLHKNSNKDTFVEDNYLGVEFREPGKECRFNKFTLKECKQLDNFRANIDELCSVHMQSLGMAANAAVIMRLPFGNVDASIDVLHHRKKQEGAYGKDTNNHDRRIGIYYDDKLNLNFDKWFRKYADDFVKGQSEYHSPKIQRANFLANLGQHVLRDCFVGGRYNKGQALAEVKERLAHQKNQLKAECRTDGSTEMDFITKASTRDTGGRPGQGMKWWGFADAGFDGSCLATNMHVTDLLEAPFCQVDCVYFDPPYGGQASDYATIYRFLEEYIYGQSLEDLPHIQKHSKDFVGKKNYGINFINMCEKAQHIPIWMFSYNDKSWAGIKHITGILKQFKNEVIVETLTDDYRYLYRSRQGRDEKSSEYLIIAR